MATVFPQVAIVYSEELPENAVLATVKRPRSTKIKMNAMRMTLMTMPTIFGLELI